MTDETAATNAAEETIASESQVAESAPAADDAGKAPEKDSFSQRIDELTRNWRDTQRRLEQAERDRELLREQVMRTQQPAKADEAIKTLADFEYDDAKYQAYLFQQAEKRAVEAAEKRLKEEQAKSKAEERKRTFLQKASEFEKSNKDFWDKARLLPQFSDALLEDIADLDASAEVVYYLANNLSIADQIARLPERAAARELGRIEARLAAEKEKLAAAKVSKAPDPPPKVDGSGDPHIGISPSSPDGDKLSADEWLRRRNKQLARKAG
jgi:hypothetical protein